MINLDWDSLPDSVGPFAKALANRPNAAHELVTMLGTLGPRLPGSDAAQFALQLRQHLPRTGRLWQVSEAFLRPKYPIWYIDGLRDETRNSAYARAITASVSPEDSVLEIGSGSGLFAMMAARAGAGHVYSCEIDPQIAQIARQNVARNGLSERITVLSKPSGKLEVGIDLPRRCDVLIHEYSSSTFVVKGTIEALSAARANLLVPGAPVLPCRYQARAMLAGDPALDRLARVGGAVEGFQIAGMEPIEPIIRSLPRGWNDPHPLSGAEVIADQDIDQGPPGDDESEVTLTVTDSGNLQGVIHWIAQIFPDGTVYENTPGLHCTWEPNFWPVPRPRPLKRGEKVCVQVTRQGCDIAIEIT